MNAEDSWFQSIESPVFTARLGVVSSLAAFDRALQHQPNVAKLQQPTATNTHCKFVQARLQRLLLLPSDARYCHESDIPIAVYLAVLDACAPESAITFARSALTVSNLWWGKLIARRIVKFAGQTSVSMKAIVLERELTRLTLDRSSASRAVATTIRANPRNTNAAVELRGDNTASVPHQVPGHDTAFFAHDPRVSNVAEGALA